MCQTERALVEHLLVSNGVNDPLIVELIYYFGLSLRLGLSHGLLDLTYLNLLRIFPDAIHPIND